MYSMIIDSHLYRMTQYLSLLKMLLIMQIGVIISVSALWGFFSLLGEGVTSMQVGKEGGVTAGGVIATVCAVLY